MENDSYRNNIFGQVELNKLLEFTRIEVTKRIVLNLSLLRNRTTNFPPSISDFGTFFQNYNALERDVLF